MVYLFFIGIYHNSLNCLITPTKIVNCILNILLLFIWNLVWAFQQMIILIIYNRWENVFLFIFIKRFEYLIICEYIFLKQILFIQRLYIGLRMIKGVLSSSFYLIFLPFLKMLFLFKIIKNNQFTKFWMIFLK